MTDEHPDLRSDIGRLIAHAIAEVDMIITGYRLSAFTLAGASVGLTLFLVYVNWWFFGAAALLALIDIGIRVGTHGAIGAFTEYAIVAAVKAEKGLTDDAD